MVRTSVLLAALISLKPLPAKTIFPAPSMVWEPDMTTKPLFAPLVSPSCNVPFTVIPAVVVSVLPLCETSSTSRVLPGSISTCATVVWPVLYVTVYGVVAPSVLGLGMTTVSPLAGTTPPAQLLAVPQSPPLGLFHMSTAGPSALPDIPAAEAYQRDARRLKRRQPRARTVNSARSQAGTMERSDMAISQCQVDK